MRYRDSMLAFLTIVFAVSLTSGTQCPQGRGCSDCDYLPEDQYEIRCNTAILDSIFIVTYKPAASVKIECHNSPNWSDFELGKEQPVRDVSTIIFKRCQLPEGKVSDVSGQIIRDSIDTLLIQNSENLTEILSRESFSGFNNLKTLELLTSKLRNVSADLLQDLQNLTRLNLRGNELQQLPDGFLDLENLESIELGDNQLQRLTPRMLEKLGKLGLLNIWSNQLVEIEAHSFDKLQSLQAITLQSNNLQTLPEDIFAKLENLINVTLSLNNFSTDSLSEKLFRNNNKLKNILFFGNKQDLLTLPPGFFGNLSQLNHVNIRRNALKYLPANLFSGSVQLSYIDMGNNLLRELPDGIFSDLHQLKTLDLSKNHITAVGANVFEGLSSLQVLNMMLNGLKTIHPQGFRSLLNLEKAIFTSNQLTLKSHVAQPLNNDRPTSPFNPCKKLEELHLAYNNISEIFYDWSSATQLKILNLKNNSLRSLYVQDIMFTSNDIRVDLSYNHIEIIAFTGVKHYKSPNDLAHSRSVSLDNNPIICNCNVYDLLLYHENTLDADLRKDVQLKLSNLKCHSPAFLKDTPVENISSSSLKCLVENPGKINTTCPAGCECWVHRETEAYLIDCSYRNLTELPDSLKTPPNRSATLDLTGNFLTEIPPHMPPGYSSITTLSLSKNQISNLQIEFLPPNLESLSLDSNNFTKLDPAVTDFFKNSTKLKHLALQENPWTCDCASRDLLTLIQQRLVEMPELQGVKCFHDDSPMFTKTPDELCPVALAVILGACVGVALLGILMGAIGALYYRFQQQIKVWLYAKQWCLWLVTEEELDKDKLYDAFVSYSHKDEEFVKGLVTKLEEGESPFKLCIHYRDWMAGEWIPTQIARSVEDSRRTIVVLSPNFLESVWGKMEFRTAHSQALSEGRARVIVILYGDIGPIDELDSELKAYLSMNTYVKWGDPWFFEKLKYALPHQEGFRRKRTVFAGQQPTIVISNDKSELIEKCHQNGTVTAASTPPADALKRIGESESERNAVNETMNKGAMQNGKVGECGVGKGSGRRTILQCTTV